MPDFEWNQVTGLKMSMWGDWMRGKWIGWYFGYTETDT